MKYSQYNNIYNISDKVSVIYNSVTDRCVFLKEFNPMGNPDTLNHETLSKLIDCGIVVRADKDETEALMNLHYQLVRDEDSFMLIVNPTLNCNFRCWYCYENHDGIMNMSSDVLEGIKKSINEILNRFSFFELSFFGGEPLLQYEKVVKPLMNFTKKTAETLGKEYIVSFTTNGYLISDEMISFFKDFKTGSFQITLDGGRENHNKTRISPKGDSFDVILGNIKKLANAGIKVLLRINVTHENIDSVKEIIDNASDLSPKAKKCVSFTIQQVWQDKTDMLEKIWEWYSLIHKNGFKISPRPYRRMSYLCYGDRKNTAVVNYNGKVYKCTAIDFDKFEHEHLVFDNDWLSNLQCRFEEKSLTRNNKKGCYSCRVFPLCTGGCEKAYVLNKEGIYCSYPTESDKDRLVSDVVRERIMMDAVYS